ncbi:MAG TPA: aldo/keto reductase, partial [Lacipirellulaceae bacterium]|nr:aldo/keto reductase [Lacipirellulaceae bacterium]
LDAAGKYGAGLALETIGANLRALGVPPGDVVLSNKLGWFRTPLRTPEPTFEPGVWVGLQHDAEQRISYRGILDCWEQGCGLLGEPYRPQLASVHDPDEYLAAAATPADRQRRWDDVLDAYRALVELRDQGQVQAVGVGAKDWRVVRDLAAAAPLDWVMIANSLTIYSHPPELVTLVDQWARRGVGVINSAVFHAGFLVGGRFFDYREVRAGDQRDHPLLDWRQRFGALCQQHEVDPAVACVQFALSPPGVVAVAMNTSRPDNVGKNARAVQTSVAPEFWRAAKEARLVQVDYPHV